MPIQTGEFAPYHWIACAAGMSHVAGVLLRCPELVLDKYVAITSFDSGPLVPNDEEVRAGWWSDGKIMYSPVISDPLAIPRELYDEWLVFAHAPARLDDVEVFINLGDFSLAPRRRVPTSDARWDLAVSTTDRAIYDRFWAQLIRIQPESYIAEGDNFLFASIRESLTKCVHEALVDQGAA